MADEKQAIAKALMEASKEVPESTDLIPALKAALKAKARPEAKIEARPHPYGVAFCANCSMYAELRCKGCSPTLDTRYCSQACQKANYNRHKHDCRSARLYNKVILLNWPGDAEFIVRFEEETSVRLDRTMQLFLRWIPVEKRCRGYYGEPQLKNNVLDAVNHLSSKTTMEAHEMKLIAAEESLNKAFKHKMNWEVPFLLRPLIVDEEGWTGIHLYVQDYETISLYCFEKSFLHGANLRLNPWAAIRDMKFFPKMGRVEDEVQDASHADHKAAASRDV